METGYPTYGPKRPIDLGGSRREGRIKVRTIKLIGLTALAALTAMALVGASSAMAEGSTALCNIDPVGTEVCPSGNLVAHVHEETLPGHKAVLLSSSLNVECKTLFLGDASPTLGNPLVLTGKFTYTECTSGCTVVEQSASSTIKVLKLGHELADVTGEGQVKLTCAFGFIKCVYNGVGLKGHGLGPLLSEETNGEVRLEEAETHIVSGSCPEKAFLDILTTPLTKTYIKS
jgi:hypothetical protein